MRITSDEAVVMFARYCRARFGIKASEQVRAKAKKLKERGDIEGHEIWNKVAQEIEKIKKKDANSRRPPASGPRVANQPPSRLGDGDRA
jgi:hypothetical protein